MRLRTFTANDMPAAMKMVRDALGENAVILATEARKGKKGISVTAAVDTKDEFIAASPPSRPASRTTGGDVVDELRFELQNILRFHNIPDLFVAKILQKATPRELSSLSALHTISANRDEKPLLRLAMEKVVGSYFQFAPLPIDDGKLRVMLIGPPGIGKTLTIAKMAARIALSRQPLAVFTTDNKRAGGIEQLQAFTNILELPLHVAPTPKELAMQLKELPGGTQVLIDTAGCNPYDAGEMQEIQALSAHKDIEPVLVLPAGGDSAEMIDTVEPFTAVPIKRLLVTRGDTARRFGGILSAAAAHKLKFCNISNSSSIVNILEPLDGGRLAQMLLRYQLQSK